MDERREQFFHHTVSDFVELVKMEGFFTVWQYLPKETRENILSTLKDQL
jgi:hypothetical protein